jgi:hypothetical protein
VQWLRAGVPVDGAVGTTYVLTPADLGSRIRARITYERPGYLPLTVATPSTALVKTVSVMTARTVVRDRRVRVSATVTAPGVPTVKGMVRIRSAGKLLAEVPLVDGAMATTIRGLPSGQRTLRVRYVGSPTVTAVETLRTVTIG